MFEYVFLDMDGTIADSFEGVANGFVYSLSKMGIHVDKLSDLRRCVGPQLLFSFQNFFGLSERESLKAREHYRDYYNQKGIFETKLYDGIEELLKCLGQSGIKIATASTKPKFYIEQIFKRFEILQYFDFVNGSNLDGSMGDKQELIEYNIKAMGIKDKSKVVMVGDTRFDLEGAEKAGVAAIGVLYGYGKKSELEKYPNIFLAESVCKLKDFLLK